MTSDIKPETVALWEEKRRLELPKLPTGYLTCQSCDGKGCNFCDGVGQEPTFRTPADRDRYFGEGGGYLASTNPWEDL